MMAVLFYRSDSLRSFPHQRLGNSFLAVLSCLGRTEGLERLHEALVENVRSPFYFILIYFDRKQNKNKITRAHIAN